MSEGTFEFLTIDRASDEILYKDKGSKFLAMHSQLKMKLT